MQEHEIHTGKDYIVKIAHNKVKVKVLSNSGRGWVAKTAGGKFIPINSIERFVRQVAPAGELPLQTPAAPAECRSVAPTGEVPLQASEAEETEITAAAIPLEPAPVPTSAPLVAEAPKPQNRLTMLDAAAIVLEKAGHPMKIKDILVAMEKSGLWTPGPGLTPDRTMQASIGLEVRKRVKHRFHKTAPGTFEYVGHRHE